MLPGRFSFFGGGGDSGAVVDNANSSPSKGGGDELAVVQPTLKLETDRQVYRPGDPVIVTIQISNPANGYSFLMERLGFEIRGIEKLDTQWFATQKLMPGSKQRRGENAFLECSTPILIANQILNAGASKSYVVRTQLPSIIPPSYKGSNIRYLYYIKSALTGGWIIYENGQSRLESKNDVTDLEVRIPLQIWINQKSSGFPIDDDVLSTQKSFAIVSPNEQQKLRKTFSAEYDVGVSSSPEAGAVESISSEGFIRGRSYNIRLDDQVLLKFSPKNSDSTYYFSDMIGGTLTFFHEGARRCLEVQSDHHEVVADLVQTSFLFSIPMDGPMSFSTQHVSVQWVLRFEFFTTPKHVDWKKYEHPLLIEGREKTEWVLPITVHAPPPRAPASGTRSDKLFSLDPMWVHN
ncbi:hypothetical protein glysoja_048095 [Glycine soja]|uniref:Uncharacterized protein n=1 Tax=Glycine soja TaxID=3848 RepID=A0A0B2SQ22_GLYSO|nr:hypothetical protein glysoja_048095 [Glycine soja]